MKTNDATTRGWTLAIWMALITHNSILFACIISSPILLLIVLAPRFVGNTDGIDPDSSENVIIDSCYIDVGDDGISIKVRTKKRNYE